MQLNDEAGAVRHSPARQAACPVYAVAPAPAAYSHKAERIFGGGSVATPVFFRLYFYAI